MVVPEVESLIQPFMLLPALQSGLLSFWEAWVQDSWGQL